VVQIEVREAILEVRKTVLGQEAVKQERIRIRPFQTNPASISVKAGATVNLGNYESARIDVMLTAPCYIEEIDDMFEHVKDWVDARMIKECKELTERSGVYENESS